jgi:hypothetical protein
MYFKREIIIFVYDSYIDGLSTEEIMGKLILFGIDIQFDDIDEIINFVNSIL